MQLNDLLLIDIESISQNIEVNDPVQNSEVLSLQPDAFSFSLPNGEILSMVPIPIQADVGYSTSPHSQKSLLPDDIPSENDLVIPHPSYTIDNILPFQVINPSSVQISSSPAAFLPKPCELTATIKSTIQKSLINSLPLPPAYNEVVNVTHTFKFNIQNLLENQWKDILSPIPFSISLVHHCLSLCSSQECAITILIRYYPDLSSQEIQSTSTPLIQSLLRQSNMLTYSNEQLESLYHTVLSIWNDRSKANEFMYTIASFAHFPVYLNKQSYYI